MLIFERPLPELAHNVTRRARASLPGCDGAGLQLIEEMGLSARAASDARSRELDRLQAELTEGPCYECLQTGTPFAFDSSTPSDRWPTFASSARRLGVVACFAVPLRPHDQQIGVLNLYAWPDTAFSGWNSLQNSTFAEEAAFYLANAVAYTRAQAAIEKLQAELLASDDAIQQAQGVLMAHQQETLPQARVSLSALADDQNGSLRQAAQSILDSLHRE
jgi:transcriptional regulator with GAF, ATPase, and Fis domain